MDTFPAVMRLCFPGVQYRFDRQDSVIVFPNQSSIFFGGLDDAERTEKILGLEFSTVYLNEASQISFGARNMLLTRLAQKSDLIVREYIDANPPTMDHWLYSLFELHVDPKSGEPLTTPEMYATMILNPEFNRENLSFDYLEQLEALPERERRRFLLGEYQTTVDCALWHMDKIRRLPAIDALNRADAARKMRRIIVAIDPSGASGPDDVRSDEIGIIVCGLDSDGNGHVLEDASIKEGPAGWAARALKAFDDWGAERLVAEKNFGGALVEATIRSIRGHAPVKMVSAARGKVARAEPVAAIYELGRVFHHGRFHALEDQLCRFSASGYQGARSPDRADALVWGLSTLMLETQTSTTWGPSLNFAR